MGAAAGHGEMAHPGSDPPVTLDLSSPLVNEGGGGGTVHHDELGEGAVKVAVFLLHGQLVS